MQSVRSRLQPSAGFYDRGCLSSALTGGSRLAQLYQLRRSITNSNIRVQLRRSRNDKKTSFTIFRSRCDGGCGSLGEDRGGSLGGDGGGSLVEMEVEGFVKTDVEVLSLMEKNRM
ncbi:Protein of unknown function [Gryllus bimaculatus]|nr:Protein of unknown function [Gryllus bimaculatus]